MVGVAASLLSPFMVPLRLLPMLVFRVRLFPVLLVCLLFSGLSGHAGNFYAGTTPSTVPWTNGVIPYLFTNTLTPAQQQTYFDGLREWQLGGNIQFVPHTTEKHWVLFTYNTNFIDNVSASTNPQVVTVSSLSRGQVCHELGHSLGFNHENIRYDRTNYLTVLTNNIISGNLVFFLIDPTTVTNGPYDFESVMHLGDNFSSTSPTNLYTQLALPPYIKYQPRMGNACLSKGDRAALNYLYGPPVVPLSNIVTNTADHGPGSLRAALYYAIDHPGSTVRFNIPTTDAGFSNGVFTMHLTGYLPPLVTDGTILDGSTQPGFSGKPLIIIDGSQMIPEAYPPGQVTGLLIYAANCQIKNLSFQNFNWNGITISYPYATNDTVAGCWLGPDYTGTNTAPNALQGILIYNGASNNIVGGSSASARNVLSGNSQYGILITGTNTVGNVVLGNYIGTDFSGRLMLSNSLGGVFIADGANHNTIGGTTTGAGNLISGNLGNGILLRGSNVMNTLIAGNEIGTDLAGTNAIPNEIAGVTIDTGARLNVVGGLIPGARNIISGNNVAAFQNEFADYGVIVGGDGTTSNTVEGNYIGVGPDGVTAVPNYFGMLVGGGATNNTFGGIAPGARNIISGNANYGMMIVDTNTSGNVLEGNYLGLDVTGLIAVPNEFGVLCDNGSSNNIIGGTSAGAGNYISGNNLYGVYLIGPSGNNFVLGNFIGTDRTGTNGLGNYAGVAMLSGTTGNTIGGVNLGAGNVIAFGIGYGYGVVAFDAGNTNNSIRGNSIFNNIFSGIYLNGNGINPPAVTNAFGLGLRTVVTGTLSNALGQSYIIDVYRNLNEQYFAYTEGRYYVGSVTVTADGSGNAKFVLTNSTGNYNGQYFTATATSISGDTSEFGSDFLAGNVPAAGAAFGNIFTGGTTNFAFALNLVTNFTYRVQATTNLAQNPIVWLDLTNFLATNSVFNFTDRATANFRFRFYRVISP